MTEYTRLNINKFFGLTLKEYMGTTEFERKLIKEHAEKVLESRNKMIDEIKRQNGGNTNIDTSQLGFDMDEGMFDG